MKLDHVYTIQIVLDLFDFCGLITSSMYSTLREVDAPVLHSCRSSLDNVKCMLSSLCYVEVTEQQLWASCIVENFSTFLSSREREKN